MVAPRRKGLHRTVTVWQRILFADLYLHVRSVAVGVGVWGRGRRRGYDRRRAVEQTAQAGLAVRPEWPHPCETTDVGGAIPTHLAKLADFRDTSGTLEVDGKVVDAVVLGWVDRVPSSVGVGVTEDDKREAIRTHGEERTALFDESDVRAIEVGKALVLRSRHEIRERKDFLERRLRLEQYERLLALRRAENIKGRHTKKAGLN